MFDYETLRVIWWLILGTLLIGFAVMDGFDLGVGAVFRFIGRTDDERRALLASIEPVWDGNQVWDVYSKAKGTGLNGTRYRVVVGNRNRLIKGRGEFPFSAGAPLADYALKGRAVLNGSPFWFSAW